MRDGGGASGGGGGSATGGTYVAYWYNKMESVTNHMYVHHGRKVWKTADDKLYFEGDDPTTASYYEHKFFSYNPSYSEKDYFENPFV